MQVLNFYSRIFADQLKRGRKTATIRLGDKSHKYKKNTAVLVTIGVLSAGWYSCVAFLFASPRAQRGYRRVRRPLDALCGAALVGLGAKLAADR